MKYGGLVLIAKAGETERWKSYLQERGRINDLILFNAESGHCFDSLFYEWNRPGRGAGDLETIIDFFSTLNSVGKKEQKGHGHDPFWERGNEQLMRNVIKLLDLAGQPISIATIDRVIKSLPTERAEVESEQWQKDSYCASLINAIRERKDRLTADQWSDLDIATQYAFKKWPAFDERPRSSLEMTWSGMADPFLFNPLNRHFCQQKCTFLPEQTFMHGKIVVVDFPMLQYQETGRLINVMMKLIFQRAWLRRDVNKHPAPCFLWQDEFQYFVTRRDNFFQQTCREARVAVVCLTQNIMNLSEELGEDNIGSKTKSFAGNLMLKVAHQQNEDSTSQYMSSLIGQEWRYVENYSVSGSDTANAGGSMQLVHQLEPIEFSRLQKPDAMHPEAAAIIYQGGKTFQASGRNHLKVNFTRNI
jgi:type IV secretory system conjugative DNA transfer VirD4/TraG family protein